MKELRDTLKRSKWLGYIILPLGRSYIWLENKTEFEAMKQIRLEGKLDTIKFNEVVLAQK